MAKRKRLEVPIETIPDDLETKSILPPPRARMPIAEVAGDTAGRAALEEVAREMTVAEGEGRVVKKLPLEAIVIDHLSRDRMVLDGDDMEALKASLSARGQQTPIEVLSLSHARFGLISGLRRLQALRDLGNTHVLALVKTPKGSQDAYQAMVEENEIRASLSFYERANIARVAVDQGVYPDVRSAVKALFAHAPKAKRSKITKFVVLHEALGATLRFPTAIPEHLGLALAKAFEADHKLAARVTSALIKAAPKQAQAERKVLEAALKDPKKASVQRIELAPDIRLETKAGRAVLSGKAVDARFVDALTAWVKQNASS